mmetsp:Transcript_17555/g.23118  ORF Transcript_17555/g.23118 Transcript_17555/m.23118 type:complete len:85 (-) Transcript_17555:888-1142(-)
MLKILETIGTENIRRCRGNDQIQHGSRGEKKKFEPYTIMPTIESAIESPIYHHCACACANPGQCSRQSTKNVKKYISPNTKNAF